MKNLTRAIFLLVVVGLAGLQFAKARATAVLQSRTSTTGVLTVAHANGQCKSDDCTSVGHCASCQTLTVYLPLTAQVVAIRCLTNAGGTGGDAPDVRVVNCAPLDAWATFDRPVQSSTPTNRVVQTVFHNRSHNRDRLVELQVDYLP
jgi:hypothetical protein